MGDWKPINLLFYYTRSHLNRGSWEWNKWPCCTLRLVWRFVASWRKTAQISLARFLCSFITNTHALHQTAEPILLIWPACIHLLLHFNNPSLIGCLHMYKMCTLAHSVVWYVYTLSGRFQEAVTETGWTESIGVPFEVANYWPQRPLGVQGALCGGLR